MYYLFCVLCLFYVSVFFASMTKRLPDGRTFLQYLSLT